MDIRYGPILLVLLVETTLSVIAQPVQFRRLAQGVTPGAVTAPPVELELDGRIGIVLSTEDRVLRFLEPETGFEIAVPVGFQVRVPVYRRDPPLFVLFGDRLAMSRADLSRRRSVPVRNAFDRSYGWTTVDRPGFPEARFDRNGNIYLFSGTTRIVHMSAAGTVLWTRDLPAPPVAVVAGGGVVYAALENGLIMRFDEHGTGTSLIRLRALPVSLAYDHSSGAGALCISDKDGGLTRYTLTDGDPRREWTRLLDQSEGAAEPRILAVVEDSCFIRSGDRLRAIDRYGRDRWTAEVSGAIHVIDRDRVLSIDRDGTVDIVTDRETRRIAELDASPEAFDLLPLSRSVFIRYRDWSWELRALEPVRDAPGPGYSPVAASREPNPTALSGLADLALDSSSAAQRDRVLSIVEERIESAELYGDVTTARRFALDLLAEVSRGERSLDRPDVRRRAVSILAVYLDDGSRAALLRVVRDDPDTTVAAAAIHALAGWGIETADTAATVAARFNREGDRGRLVLAEPIVEFLESLVGSREEDLQQLAVLLAGSDIDPDLRRRAVDAARSTR